MSDTVRNLSEAREILARGSFAEYHANRRGYVYTEAAGFISGIMESPLTDLLERAEVRALVEACVKACQIYETDHIESGKEHVMFKLLDNVLQPFLSAEKESK